MTKKRSTHAPAVRTRDASASGAPTPTIHHQSSCRHERKAESDRIRIHPRRHVLDNITIVKVAGSDRVRREAVDTIFNARRLLRSGQLNRLIWSDVMRMDRSSTGGRCEVSSDDRPTVTRSWRKNRRCECDWVIPFPAPKLSRFFFPRRFCGAKECG